MTLSRKNAAIGLVFGLGMALFAASHRDRAEISINKLDFASAYEPSSAELCAMIKTDQFCR